jgi:DNA-binding MarR family transcriptional regulator
VIAWLPIAIATSLGKLGLPTRRYTQLTTSSRNEPRDYVADPLIGPLLRAPLQAIRARMLDGVAAAGYHDIGAAHFNILQHPTPEGLRPSEVAARAQMTKQAANRLIRHLERRGYLTLEPDASDQRARILRLTEKGRALIAIIRAVVEEVEAEWSQRLGRHRFETLRGLLRELGEPPA